ncbi:MAG: padE 1 [Firmicutes bacterium]|nr:padE 1 [Bacillota bacterium]
MMEIRLSGSGGQGLILAGIILAEAAIGDGKEAIQSQSYGPEARGGSSKSEVIISDKRIHYPKVTNPNLLLAMTQEALNKYGADLKDDGLLIVDSTLVREVPERFKNVHTVPITQLAKEKCGRELFANIVALGTITKLTSAVSLEAIEKAVLARVPKGTEEMNKQALQIGYQAV